MRSAGTVRVDKRGWCFGRISPVAVMIMLISVFSPFEEIAQAASIHVDGSLSADCTSGNYSIANRNCTGSDGNAYRRVNIVTIASAGDIVYVRGGTYSGNTNAFDVKVSGVNATNPPTYVTFQNYPGETPIFSGQTATIPSLLIENRSAVKVAGIRFQDAVFLFQAIDSNNIMIDNCTFYNGTDSGTRVLKIVRGHHNIVQNSVFDKTNGDSLGFEDSNYNLVIGNTFTDARHNLLRFACSSYNIAKNNTFYNARQKTAEEYDCEGGISSTYHGDTQVVKLNATKHNFWDNNAFTKTPLDDGGGPYGGIQYCGQNGVVRFNRFYNCGGSGLDAESYSDECLYPREGRFVHNTFYNNYLGGFHGNWAYASGPVNNKLFNNISYNNLPTTLNWSSPNQSAPEMNLRQLPSNRYYVYNNIIYNDNTVNTVRIGNDSTPALHRTVAQAEAEYPNNFYSNIASDPLLENASAYNFNPLPNSPSINAGAFLTTSVGVGSGTTMTVADATFFHDGFDIPGVQGDLIQLQGQTTAARVIDVNYETNVLTLDTSLTWSNGQGVAYTYSGSAPDIGSFEYVGPVDSRVPSPPTNLRVE